MTTRRIFVLIAIMTVLGVAKVAQQTTLRLMAYELGTQYTRLHELENDAMWLETQVVGLRGPVHLDKLIEEERLKLVAWSEFPEGLRVATFAQAIAASRHERLTD